MRALAVAVVVAVLASPRTGRADDYTVHATGCFVCEDGAGEHTWPLSFAQVQLMDSDCDGSTVCDDLMGYTETKANGCFDVTGRGGDPGSWSWSKPDPYIMVRLMTRMQPPPGTDIYLALVDDVENKWTFTTDQHSHDNTDGNIDFGSVLTGTGNSKGQSTKCSLLLAGQRELNSYAAKPYSLRTQLQIEWPAYLPAYDDATPWTGTDTIHWRTYVDWRTITHEFAHLVRNELDGDDNHWLWDASRFRYGRKHEQCDSKQLAETDYNQQGFAFSEGWAEFWEGDVFWNCSNPNDMRTEGNVASALWSLNKGCPTLQTEPGECWGPWVVSETQYQACKVDADCTGPTGVNGHCLHGAATMLQVLSDNPEKIHTFDEYKSAFQLSVPGCGLGVSNTPVEIPPKLGFTGAPGEARRLHTAAISALTDKLQQAQSAAALHPPCGEKDDCWGAFQVAIAPALIQAELDRAKLWGTLMAPELSEQPPRVPEGEAIGAWLTTRHARAEKYRSETIALSRRAFTDAIAATLALANSSKPAAALRLDLQKKLAGLEAKVLRNEHLPEQWFTPPIGLDAPPQPTTPKTPPPPAPHGCKSCNAAGLEVTALPVLLLLAARRRRRQHALVG